ncbi:MAG: CotH kinase family protein [Bacteroidetes bacterium]|nr:CotH kinase family protein [Bacteroidota bacterium]
MKKYSLIFTALLIIVFNACREDGLLDEIDDETEEIIDLSDYADWTEATHSNIAEPDYSVVFNQNKVLRFDIEINSSDWSTMQSDLQDILGSSGGGGPQGGGAPADLGDTNPMWIPCSFNFNGKQWYNVGIRYKGNSSLRSAQSGNNKLSLKLDFDEFEDDYPALKNQRFYGFKQLNLNNNYNDASLMREKVGADLFREFGLISAQTTFCTVYINNGSGSQYFGVYALVEEVDDTVLDTQLGDDSGNLYKPDGTAASFASGSYKESEMEKKNNEELADYSDVKSLYDVVNSSTRTSDVTQWKSDLEEVLNVDGFLKWLAANIVIQNWDTYGRMTHNYYLYNNPENDLLTWIPWDNNEALQYGKQGGALSLSLNEVGSGWPLISYLIADSEYKEIYEAYMRQFVDEVFVPSKMIEKYEKYYLLLKDYAYAEESGYTFIKNNSQFDEAVQTLKSHVQQRNDAVFGHLN